MSFCSLQSNVENADSMLPWTVKIKIDRALEINRRKRTADRANSARAPTLATASCIATQSSGSANSCKARDGEAGFKLSCNTVLRRNFCFKTCKLDLRANAGLRAFQSAPSTIIRELLNLKQSDVVNKHFTTDNAV